MSTDSNLRFLQEKIKELGNAIMYSMSNEVVRFPNSIITATRVDDEGHLYFLCEKPSFMTEQCPEAFPARLHFYRKGVLFHVEVSGRTTVVNEHTGQGNRLLLKMDMLNISYVEAEETKKGWLEIIIERLHQWMLRNISIPHPSKSVLQQLSEMKQS